jgi:hypothetical protein
MMLESEVRTALKIASNCDRVRSKVSDGDDDHEGNFASHYT